MENPDAMEARDIAEDMAEYYVNGKIDKYFRSIYLIWEFAPLITSIISLVIADWRSLLY